MKMAVVKRLLFIFIALFLLSCENLITDLPETNTNTYITGNTVTFPRGTKAIDIYNTVTSLYDDNEWHDVVGEWKYIRTTTSNGLTNQTWQSVSFTKIRYIHTTKAPQINDHVVFLYTNDANIKEIIFQWQRQTTNIWKNESVEGDIVFTF